MERYLIDVIGPVLKPARVTAIHHSIKFALLHPNVQVALLCETRNSACSAESEACRVRKQTALHPLVIVCCLGLTGRHIQGVSYSKNDAEHILSFIFSNLLKDKVNLTKLSPPSLDRWSRASLRWSRGEHSCKPRSCRSREWTCLQKEREDDV